MSGTTIGELLLKKTKSSQGIEFVKGQYYWWVVSKNKDDMSYHFSRRGYTTRGYARMGLTRFFNRFHTHAST